MNSDILNSTPKDDPPGDKDTPKAARGSHQKENEAEDLAVLNGAQLLLVEDNEITQQVVREILESAGIIVTLANNGLEAFQLVKINKYDAILMDIQMPVMDGYAAAREIRKWESGSGKGEVGSRNAECGSRNENGKESNLKSEIKGVPIIAITGNSMAGDKEKSIQAGMNDHLTKPINLNELFGALQKWISRGARQK